jgi:hypothetical protein
MSWKGTAILAGVLAVLGGVYLLTDPGRGGAGGGDMRLLAGFTPERLVRFEIARKGEPPYTLERAADALGAHWRLQPADRPADPDAVQKMIWALDRFRRAGGLDPGRPETAPSLTGLSDPRLVVRVELPDASATLRFGQSPPTHTAAVFFQKEGDPKIYLIDLDTFQAFDKAASALRERRLVRYAPFQVVRLDLERRFLVVREKGRPAVVEYERSTFERVEQGAERGWFLTRPHREKVDDLKVQRLITDLAGLEVAEFRPAGDGSEDGFAEPEVRYALTLNGRARPIVVEVGALAPDRRRRHVRVAGSAEVALVEARRCDDLAAERKHLRIDAIYPFTKDAVKTFDLEAPGQGRLRIERRLVKKEGAPFETPVWEVVEPRGIKVDPERVEPFVADALHPHQRIQDFLGPQDLALAGLEPPAVTLRVETQDGRVHTSHFGLRNEGYLRREGADEVFQVRPEYVRRLLLLELNVLHEEMFNVPREKLREFAFEAKPGALIRPVYYRLRLDAASGKWVFADPGHEGKEPDEDRVRELLAAMNYIRAEAFVGRGPEAAAKYGLGGPAAPAALTILWEGGPPEGRVLLVSEDQSDRPTHPVYYARFRDNPVVFRISSLFVESLRRVPLKK